MTLRDAATKPIITHGRRISAMGGMRVRSGALTPADLLAPDGIARLWGGNAIQVGDSYLTTLEVRSFPPTLLLAWLSDPRLDLDAPDIIVRQRVVPVADAVARRLLAQSEDAALGTLSGDLAAGTNLDIRAEQGLEAAAALRRAVGAGADRLFQYAVTITIAAPTLEALATRVAMVRQAAAQQGIALGIARFQQWEGYVESLPLGHAVLCGPQAGVLHDASGRAVAMGLPTAPPGLRNRGGSPIVWGEEPRSGAPILWDRWQATNPHALIIAESGSGKTYAIAGLLVQELALGDDAILILDPKFQEYRALVTALGGSYITLSRQAGHHINPLHLPQLTPERARIVAALDEDLLGQRIAIVTALICREVRAMGTLVDALRQAQIEAAIAAAYAARGITADPATFHRPAPILSDVQAALATQDADFARALTLFTQGTIGDLFNHPSNIPTTTALLALDLSALLRSNDETLARLLPVIVLDFFVTTALHRPTGRRSHVVLDEAHVLLQSDVGARALEVVYRIGRSLSCMATVITQRVRDLDTCAQTQVLLENAKTKLILGLNRDSDAVAHAAALLGLNAAEAAYVASCRLERGVGATALLLADGERTPLLIPPWPETIHRLVTGQPRGDEDRGRA